MDAALRARLAADVTITAQTGNRIYWAQRPQATELPALVLQEVSPGRTYTHDGATNLQGTRVQFDCFGATALQSRRLGDAVVEVMEAEAIVAGVQFAMSFLDSKRDDRPEHVPGFGLVYRVSIDMIVWWSRV